MWLRELLGDDFFFDVDEVSYHEGFSDEQMTHIAQLTSLESLNLTKTSITDAGLEHVEGLTNLKWISLEGTAVTDAGLVHLKGLTGLDKLVLNNTRVTDRGVEDLRQALPDCTIYHVRTRR